MKRFIFGVLLILMPLATAMGSGTDLILPYEDETTGLWGYETSDGNTVIAPQFTVALAFSSEGIAAVADDSGWKVIDRTGQVLIRPFVFDNGPDPFQEGLARFTEQEKFGFFDEQGKVVIPAGFDFALPFADGVAAFCVECRKQQEKEHTSYRGGKWGYIDRKGQVVIQALFEEAGTFEQGRARVMRNGKMITINRKGQKVK